jgi:hypothetical protein
MIAVELGYLTLSGTADGDSMRHLISLLFFAVIFPTGAYAEPISFRCDGQYFREPQPYFMTFDIEKRHFVFERAGGNLIPGEIASVSDELLDLSLRGVGGRILLSFERKRNLMRWPGMPAGELGRFEMHHICTAVVGRTVLSMFYKDEQFDPKRRDPLDAFSLSCPGNTGLYFITMDRVTKSVVVETEHFSGLISGDITGVSDGIIKFSFGRGPSDQHDALWDEGKRSLTLIGATQVKECTVTEPRSIMVGYERRWGQ